MITDKQKEYIKNSNKRWNVKIGGTGTGKTWIDYNYTIPYRVKSFKDVNGLCLLVGVTNATLERNILTPMREQYGSALVGDIVKGSGTVMLFGETFHVIGAEKENAINKIQGATVKYVYGDEVVNWNEKFFKMLTTRMRADGAMADLTGNPSNPSHWFKKFVDEMQEEDMMFYQHSTIYDNPSLSKEFVRSQEIELKGTAEYYRYILGQWVSEEGSIYPMFDENNIVTVEQWEAMKKDVKFVQVGVDFGGHKSKTSFQATALMDNLDLITFKERRFSQEDDIDYINTEFEKFITELKDEGFSIRVVRLDSAEQVIIRSMWKYANDKGFYSPNNMRNARKGLILDRIRFYQRYMNINKYRVLETCTITREAFTNAIWSDKTDKDGKEKRLDDGTLNIDTLDAQEYSTEELHKKLLKEH